MASISAYKLLYAPKYVTIISMSDILFAGYHGTSISNARSIERDDFQNNGNPIYFALMDNLNFAMQHGQRRAGEYNDSQYGVVLANFPPQELKLGLQGDQLEVPPEDIGRIIVRNVLVFETHPSGLQIPTPSAIETQ